MNMEHLHKLYPAPVLDWPTGIPDSKYKPGTKIKCVPLNWDEEKGCNLDDDSNQFVCPQCFDIVIGNYELLVRHVEGHRNDVIAPDDARSVTLLS